MRACCAPLHYDRIAAIPYAALPIGTAVALQTGQPLIYPRREAKAYGTRSRSRATTTRASAWCCWTT